MNDNHFAWQRTKPSAHDREFGLANDGSSNPEQDRSSNPEQDGNGVAPRQRKEPLAVGTQAPDFHLKDTPDQRVSLSDFAGRPVVLAFYPADFSPVCSNEMSLFNELIDEFRRYDAQMLGISVDNVWCHLAFAKDRNIQFPLLSDFHPKGEVSKAYNAYREDDGESERALYVIDPDGKIAWSHISPIGVNPGADGVLDALERLKTRTAAAA
jgi:peroxiredoxin